MSFLIAHIYIYIYIYIYITYNIMHIISGMLVGRPFGGLAVLIKKFYMYKLIVLTYITIVERLL